MPKIELSDQELLDILDALDMALRSAKRAQNTGRSPQIIEIWRQHEKGIALLMHKISALPTAQK